MSNRHNDRLPILEIENLHYSYVTDWLFRKVPALKGITITVHNGEAFGFLGPNGSGKTTTIKCILGLIRAATGTVKIAGVSNTLSESRKNLGYLPEQPYFYDHLTPLELVRMYATLSELPWREISRSSREALDRVGMAARSRSPLRSLSKGLMQRVGMAQAIVAKPALLVLDEPFSGLDPIGRKEFRDLLLDLKGSGTSIFMSSHILSDVEFVCDRASILINGDIKGLLDLKEISQQRSGSVSFTVTNFHQAEDVIRSGALNTVVQGSRLSATFKDRGEAEQVLLAALGTGASLESFDYDVLSLEEIFMDLVKKSKQREVQP